MNGRLINNIKYAEDKELKRMKNKLIYLDKSEEYGLMMNISKNKVMMFKKAIIF